jgi:hypothetical protein
LDLSLAHDYLVQRAWSCFANWLRLSLSFFSNCDNMSVSIYSPSFFLYSPHAAASFLIYTIIIEVDLNSVNILGIAFEVVFPATKTG